MNEVKISPFDNDITDKIYQVASQIKNMTNRVNNTKYDVMTELLIRKQQQINEEKSYVLCRNVQEVLLYWVSHTYIGVKKERDIQNAFQMFFQNLYEFLIVCKNSSSDYLIEFSKNALYQGFIYRYLGYASPLCDDIHKRIEPMYNDICVSWSKCEKK